MSLRNNPIKAKCAVCSIDFISASPRISKVCSVGCRNALRRMEPYKRHDKWVYKGVHKKAEVSIYKRNCLRCDKGFKTKNKFQRICDICHRNMANRNILNGWEYGGVSYGKL